MLVSWTSTSPLVLTWEKDTSRTKYVQCFMPLQDGKNRMERYFPKLRDGAEEGSVTMCVPLLACSARSRRSLNMARGRPLYVETHLPPRPVSYSAVRGRQVGRQVSIRAFELLPGQRCRRDGCNGPLSSITHHGCLLMAKVLNDATSDTHLLDLIHPARLLLVLL